MSWEGIRGGGKQSGRVRVGLEREGKKWVE